MQNSMDSGLPLKNKWCSQSRKMCKKLVLLVATSEEKGTGGEKETFFSLYVSFRFKILLCAYTIQNN